MVTLANSQRKYLRSIAHHLNPVVMIGKEGVTEDLLAKVNRELVAHELIKVRFLEHKDLRRELAAEIARDSASALVGLIGHIAILYRENADPERRKVLLPGP